MLKWALLWYMLSLATVQISAAANKTIDDLEPHTHYNDIARINGGCCVVQALSGETAEFGLDSTQVNNGTVSRIIQNTIPADLKLMQMEMHFTAVAPGTGLYLYFAHDGGSGGATDFFLDNVLVGNFSLELDPKNTKPTYNILGYANSSIPPGNHTVGMRLTRGVMYFDYAIVNPGDAFSSSSSGAVISTGLAASTTLPTSTSSSVPSSDPKRNKVPVAAIVGGSIGGIAVVLAILASLLCRRAQRRKGIAATQMEESPARAPASQVIPPDNSPMAIDPVAAKRIQLLEEQVRRLTQHAEGSSAAESDAASVSVGRSLSTMKREQTRAVQDREHGHFATDALVHTDSGLRLTAGRVVEELPPTYVPA